MPNYTCTNPVCARYMHRLTSDLKPGDKVLAPREGVEEKQPATVIELPCPYCHESLEYMDG